MKIASYEMEGCAWCPQTAGREAEEGLGSPRRQLDNDGGTDRFVAFACNLIQAI